ncbi:MAG TPA: DUF1992 domain-containing protein, partial [Steroidobacteraceae bacterium]|nr:DUF1992 domain-containing protein [Steroidobacteraceae bacterium]
ETRIRDAIDRGEFDGLSGAGRRLELDDDRDVPAELRVAYRILKNAGCVPPEVELRRQIASVESLVQLVQHDAAGHRRALAKLALLRLRLSETRRRGPGLDPAYETRLIDRLNSRSSC